MSHFSTEYLEEINPQELSASRFSLYANTYFGFLGYLAKRNRGYFQRKLFNLIHEFFELGCVAWVVDLSYLRSFLIIPLCHFIASALQEYYSNLIRNAPQHYLEKRNTPLEWGFYLMTAFLIYICATQIVREGRVDAIALSLFSIRCITIVVQTALTPYLSRVTAFRRIRPNMKWIWISSFSAWVLSFFGKAVISGPGYLFLVVLIFNSMRLFQEISYFLTVRNETLKSCLSSTQMKWANRSSTQFKEHLVAMGLNLLVFGFFSLQAHAFTFRERTIVIFFALSFFDRIISRFFRSLSLDLLKIESAFFRIQQYALNRLTMLFSVALIMPVFVSVFRHQGWPKVIALDAIVLLLNSLSLLILVINRKSFEHRNIYFFSRFISLICVCLRLRAASYVFLVSECVAVVLAIYSIFKKETRVFGELSVTEFCEVQKTLDARPIFYQFDWVDVVPLRNKFTQFIEKNRVSLLSLNRKTKIAFLHNIDEWKAIRGAFPMNVQKVHPIKNLPALAELSAPLGAREVKLNAFGFWKIENFKIKPELARFLFFVSRAWRTYPFLKGKKVYRSKNLGVEIGPLDYSGKRLWLKELS